MLSDIHIGDNSRTCWYQRSLHEPYLAAVLDYVIAHAAGADPITKLVVLGDLFDFWTYPPEQKPPTVEQIIAANDEILGPGGKLAQAIAAVHGNAIYLHGNHDIGITQADLDLLDLGDHRLTLVDDVVVERAASCSRTATSSRCSTRPTSATPARFPWGISSPGRSPTTSRTRSRRTRPPQACRIRARRTASDLASFIPALWADLASPSVTNTLLDYMAARCGLSETAPSAWPTGPPRPSAGEEEVRRPLGRLGGALRRRPGRRDLRRQGGPGRLRRQLHGVVLPEGGLRPLRARDGDRPHAPSEGRHPELDLPLPQLRVRMPLAHWTSPPGGPCSHSASSRRTASPELWCVLKDAQGYCVKRVPSPPSDSSSMRRSWTTPAT